MIQDCKLACICAVLWVLPGKWAAVAGCCKEDVPSMSTSKFRD